MKQSEMILNTPDNNLTLEELENLFGEQYIGTSYDTPLRKDAFDLPGEEKNTNYFPSF